MTTQPEQDGNEDLVTKTGFTDETLQEFPAMKELIRKVQELILKTEHMENNL